MFENIDKDGSGKIDYSEFISASISRDKILSKEKMKKVFNMFDKDGSGALSIDELKAHFSMGEDSAEEWDKIISDVDENNDGEISYEEFLKIMDKMVR